MKTKNDMINQALPDAHVKLNANLYNKNSFIQKSLVDNLYQLSKLIVQIATRANCSHSLIGNLP
jgi:hypothetical protein